MKNIILKSTALAAVMAMTMSGCSNEELAGNNDQPEVKGITTVTLKTPQEGPSTRLEYNTDNITQALGVKWKAGAWSGNSDYEKAFCINASYNALYGRMLARNDDGGAASKAEFKFRAIDLSIGSTAYAGSIGLLYPFKADYLEAFNLNGSSNSSVEATLPLSGQTGRLADMQNFDYMTAMAAVPQSAQFDTDLNITFKHRIAVMRLTGLTFPTGTSGAATSVSISGTGLKTDAILTFTKGANNTLTESLVLGATEGAIATTGSFDITNNVMEDVYICFFPGNTDTNGSHEITALKVTATVGGETYEYNYSGDAGVATKITKFVEGKMYTLTGKAMTASASSSSSVFDAAVTASQGENYSRGSGTAQDPYIISNAMQLQKFVLASSSTNCYQLATDIEVKDDVSWKPIYEFAGTFDGNNHKITGTLRGSDGYNHMGFFGSLKGATIKNLTVEADVTNTGTSYTGGIAAYNHSGTNTIINCTVRGTITGNNAQLKYTGGIVGNNSSGSIINCHFDGTMIGYSNCTGGITGDNGGTVYTCCTNNDTAGFNMVGGSWTSESPIDCPGENDSHPHQ